LSWGKMRQFSAVARTVAIYIYIYARDERINV
jgi:hypothetical protein